MAPVIQRTPSFPSATTIPLGEYLFLRVAQANPKLKSIFGVPGDFNLALLEHLYADSVVKDKGIRFLNLCNELNAAYAADGYSRAMDGTLSVLITTFGVGELSAINGIAGSFTEYIPVLHIVGTTSTRQIRQAQSVSDASQVKNIHHLALAHNGLFAPNHDVYKHMVDGISVVQETLEHEDSDFVKFSKIDRVLRTIIQESRPGYLFVPSDLSDVLVDKAGLSRPFEVSELSNAKLLNEITDRICQKLYRSKQPSVLGDALISRFNLDKPFGQLISKFPPSFVKLFSTNMGRNIDESLPNFIGPYNGKLSPTKQINDQLEQNTDLLIAFGVYNGETNTGSYTTDFSHIADYVEIHPDYVLIDGEYVSLHPQPNATSTQERELSMKDLVCALAERFDPAQMKFAGLSNISYKFYPQLSPIEDQPSSDKITQRKLADFFNDYLQPNDVLVVETCSFLFAMLDIKFPTGVRCFNQSMYGSIGYAVPATFGVCAAQRDLNPSANRDSNQAAPRIILIQGDGAAQMTIQELSSFLRFDVEPPQIFLLNNSGYTVERIIKGPTRSYNDIQDTWQWTQLLRVFGDDLAQQHHSAKVKTMAQLNQYVKTVNQHSVTAGRKIELMELVLDKMDAPERFSYIVGQKPLPF